MGLIDNVLATFIDREGESGSRKWPALDRKCRNIRFIKIPEKKKKTPKQSDRNPLCGHGLLAFTPVINNCRHG